MENKYQLPFKNNKFKSTPYVRGYQYIPNPPDYTSHPEHYNEPNLQVHYPQP